MNVLYMKAMLIMTFVTKQSKLLHSLDYVIKWFDAFRRLSRAKGYKLFSSTRDTPFLRCRKCSIILSACDIKILTKRYITTPMGLRLRNGRISTGTRAFKVGGPNLKVGRRKFFY